MSRLAAARVKGPRETATANRPCCCSEAFVLLPDCSRQTHRHRLSSWHLVSFRRRAAASPASTHAARAAELLLSRELAVSCNSHRPYRLLLGSGKHTLPWEVLPVSRH